MAELDAIDKILAVFDAAPLPEAIRLHPRYEEAKSALQGYIAQHTKQAELKARINVMQQWEADLAYACVYTYDAPYFANQRAIVQKNLTELSAPQQSKERSA